MKKMNLSKLAAAITVSVASVSAQAASYAGGGTIDSTTFIGGFFNLAANQEVVWGVDIVDSVIGAVSTGDISGDYATNGTTDAADGARFVIWNEGLVNTPPPVVPILFNGTLGLLSSTLTVDGSDITGGSLSFFGNSGGGQQATISLDFDAGIFNLYAGTAVDAANLAGSGTINVNGVSQGPSPSAVPVPAAAWLFGTALVGLAGVGRKRAA